MFMICLYCKVYCSINALTTDKSHSVDIYFLKLQSLNNLKGDNEKQILCIGKVLPPKEMARRLQRKNERENAQRSTNWVVFSITVGECRVTGFYRKQPIILFFHVTRTLHSVALV